MTEKDDVEQMYDERFAAWDLELARVRRQRAIVACVTGALMFLAVVGSLVFDAWGVKWTQ